MSALRRLTVLGGGAWGTALAATAQRAGAEVLLWIREPEVVEAVNSSHENAAYLPGIALDPTIRATADLAAAAAFAQVVLMVVPAQHVREVARACAGTLPVHVPVIIAAKGIEVASGATMGEVLAAELPDHPQAVLSGPTFAAEVARGLPTAVTLAASDLDLGRALMVLLGTPTFRPYLSDDPIGCQIGGAVKNVLAIASGIICGRGLGDNARAALITRGLAELTRLAIVKGGKAATLSGLSGIGDLTLTCTATQSRNYSLGLELGEGRSLKDILASRRSVAEGVMTARAVASLASRLAVEMPIVAAVDAILHHGAAIDDEIRKLLSRRFKTEDEPAA